MTPAAATKVEQQLGALRAPFAAEHVGLLPKITCRDCSEARGKCCDKHKKSKCNDCGNWITEKHLHLDYVGHGAVTDRLLEVDPQWNWEPVRFDEAGIPTFVYDNKGNPIALWIRLTVAGVTRLGVGTCPSGQTDAEKVLIGDALRNAAMRFGVALDLWIKGHAEDDEKAVATDDRRARDRRPPEPQPAPEPEWEPHTASQQTQFAELTSRLGDDEVAALRAWFKANKVPAFEKCTREQADQAIKEAARLVVVGPEPSEQEAGE